MNPDNTAIVQIRGGRGDYAAAKGRFLKVPFDNVEVANYKARIGGRALRGTTPPETKQINDFVARMRSEGRDVPGFDPQDTPEDQLDRVEAIAESAEDAGFNDIRDNLLNLKGQMRGEGSDAEVEDEVKAILGVTDEEAPDAGQDQGTPAPEGGEVPRSEAGRGAVRQRLRQGAVDGGLWADGGRGAESEVFESRLNMEPGAAADFEQAFGRAPREFQELRDADAFVDRLHAAKVANPYGAMVTEYDIDAYDNADTRLFTSEDGLSGFALRDGEIVSVFSHPDAPRNSLDEMLPLAIQEGGNRLDAFDGGLGKLYGRYGFKASARMDFDSEYKPDDWDDDLLGTPDVLFMHLDPKADLPAYADGDGERVTDYDEGIARAQKDATDANEAIARLPDPEPEPTPDLLPERGRDDGGVPGEGAGEPERVAPREPKPARERIQSQKPKKIETDWQMWQVILGLGNWEQYVPDATRNMAKDSGGSSREVPGLDEVKEADRGARPRLRTATWSPSSHSEGPLDPENAAMWRVDAVRLNDLPDGAEDGSPANDLANELYAYRAQPEVLNYLEDQAPELNEAFANFERALRTGKPELIRDAYGNFPFADFADDGAPNAYRRIKRGMDKVKDLDEPGKAPDPTPEGPTEWTDIDPRTWIGEVQNGDIAAMLGEDAEQPGDAQGLKRYMRLHRGDVPQRVLRKGDKDIAIMHDMPAEMLADFQRAWDEVVDADPFSGRKIAMLNDFGQIRSDFQDYTGVYADAVPGGNVARFNIRKLQANWKNPKQAGNFHMPAAYAQSPYDAMKYTLAHEYGHMRGPRLKRGESIAEAMATVFRDEGIDFPSFEEWNRRRKSGNPAERLPYHLTDFYNKDGSFGPGYELYAEMYAEYRMTNGESDDPMVQAFAKAYNLGTPVPPEDRLPDDIAGSPRAAPAGVPERLDKILAATDFEDVRDDIPWILDIIRGYGDEDLYAFAMDAIFDEIDPDAWPAEKYQRAAWYELDILGNFEDSRVASALQRHAWAEGPGVQAAAERQCEAEKPVRHVRHGRT